MGLHEAIDVITVYRYSVGMSCVWQSVKGDIKNFKFIFPVEPKDIGQDLYLQNMLTYAYI